MQDNTSGRSSFRLVCGLRQLGCFLCFPGVSSVNRGKRAFVPVNIAVRYFWESLAAWGIKREVQRVARWNINGTPER
jgi:hypothetical protein